MSRFMPLAVSLSAYESQGLVYIKKKRGVKIPAEIFKKIRNNVCKTLSIIPDS